MRPLVFVLASLLLLAGCRSGSIETAQVENPDVTAVAVPTRTAPTAVPDIEPTPTAEIDNSAVADETPPPADQPSSDDVDSESASLPAGAPEPTGNGAGTDTSSTEPPAEEASAQESTPEVVEDVVDEPAPDPDDLLTLDVGAGLVDPTDPWCVAAERVNENYRAVSAVDQTDSLYLEAVFRQTYASVEVAAGIAPAEIENAAEIERWVWEQVVQVHADANWVITSVDFARVDELGQANSGALQTVDEYTSRTCG